MAQNAAKWILTLMRENAGIDAMLAKMMGIPVDRCPTCGDMVSHRAGKALPCTKPSCNVAPLKEEDNPFEKYRKSLGDIKPSKLYQCSVCGGKWYGRSLEKGYITSHVNRTPGPAFNKSCPGAGKPAVDSKTMKEAVDVSDVDESDIERAAEKVHDEWMKNQKKQGHDSHKSPDGKEEYMVDYDDLSAPAKKLDRDAAKAVLSALKEDAPAMSVGSGGVAGIGVNQQGQPSTDKYAEPGVPVRKKLEAEDTFAGADVFKVNMDKIMSSRFAPKNRYHRYAKYIGKDEDAEDIRSAARSHQKDIVLQDRATGVMQYLRRR
jgi:hypothetical protein